jgi:hypothetical protein
MPDIKIILHTWRHPYKYGGIHISYSPSIPMSSKALRVA